MAFEHDRGRRNNGLRASDYLPAGDVDPRIGEHLLDVLALERIAAYLQPSSEVHPVTRTMMLPQRPIDQLWVERAHIGRGRALVGQLLGEQPRTENEQPRSENLSSGADFERAWAELVAEYDRSTAEPPAAGAPSKTTEPIIGLDVPFAPDERVEDPEDNYEPPAPPPIPRISGTAIGSVLLAVAGLVLMLHPTLLPLSETFTLMLGLLGLLGGSALLVNRLRPGGDDDDDDDGDDGARV